MEPMGSTKLESARTPNPSSAQKAEEVLAVLRRAALLPQGSPSTIRLPFSPLFSVSIKERPQKKNKKSWQTGITARQGKSLAESGALACSTSIRQTFAGVRGFRGFINGSRFQSGFFCGGIGLYAVLRILL